MKISEIIKKLQAVKKDYGDILVGVANDDNDGLTSPVDQIAIIPGNDDTSIALITIDHDERPMLDDDITDEQRDLDMPSY